MATGSGRQGGGIGKGAMKEMGRGATGMGRGWQWGGGQREEEMERGGNGEGAKMGRGQWEKRWGWGEEGARGGEISQMDIMGCLGGHRL